MNPDLIHRAAEALAELDRATAAQRAAQARVDAICREYSDAVRVPFIRPCHLRQAVEARMERAA